MLRRALIAVVAIYPAILSLTVNAQPPTPPRYLTSWQRTAQRLAQAHNKKAAKKPTGKCGHATCDGLISKVHAQGRITIIVELNDQDLPPLPTRGTKKERLNKLHLRQSAVQQKQDKFLQRFQAAHRIDVLSRRSNSASFGLRVDEAALRALVNDADVKSISENIFVYPSLRASVPLIGADYMWANGFTGSDSSVAILDTGVETTHPFLTGLVASRVIDETCHSGGDPTTTSLCPNGQTSQYGAGAAVPCTLPECEHGTHVAGIAAGNGSGFSGVGKEANIVAMQVFSATAVCPTCITSSSLDFGSALDDVISIAFVDSIAAVNLSLGSAATFTSSCDDENPDITTRIENLRLMGVATVIASGNNSCVDQNGNRTGCSTGISFPACISSAISVGATTKSDIVAPYGNSSDNLSLLAPGGDGIADLTFSSDCSEAYGSICSSVPGGGFEWLSGTSMAAPHVAGAVALLKQQSPTASAIDLLRILQSSGKPVTDSRNGVTKPRIDLHNTPWVARYSTAPNGTTVNAMTTDSSGNVYVTGQQTDPNSGLGPWMTVKYDTNGRLQWTQLVDTPDLAEGYAITTDATGNVYVSGITCDACSQATMTTIKYDTNGNQQWIANYPPSSPDNGPFPGAIAVDVSGNVIVVGAWVEPVQPGVLGQSSLIVKYDANGNQLWEQKYSFSNNDGANLVTVDASDNIYVGGDYCTSGPGCNGDVQSEILKYSPDGALLWVQRDAAALVNGPNGMVTDNAGNSYVAGYGGVVKYAADGSTAWTLPTAASFITLDGNGNVDTVGSDVNGVVTTRKYDFAGNSLWSTSYPALVTEMGIAADSIGDVFSVVWDCADADCSAMVARTVKYDNNGNQVWSVEQDYDDLDPPFVGIGQAGAKVYVVTSTQSSGEADFVVGGYP